MAEIVIATHGDLADGLKMSLEFILGAQKNLIALCAYTPKCPDLPKAVEKILSDHKDEDVIFITDIFGGSVNNDLQQIVNSNPKLHLVCGANLPLLIQLFNSLFSKDTKTAIQEAISAGKQGIINCDDVVLNNRLKEVDFDSF